MIVGTAGHIDHGKTTLVRALTGVDTDRLPEEKRRGITIELGFAPLELDGIGTVGVVDVPGHEAFVRTMLAGAAGIDVGLLVIAADDGVRPQTREHLAILELLEIRGGVVAVTKCDLVDADWIDLVEEDVRALVADTAFRDAPIVRVRPGDEAAIGAVRSALAAALAGASRRAPDEPFRLPVDRVFTVRGTGTVVTGTTWSGTLAADAEVRVLPSGSRARVRAVQMHGVGADRARPGERTAVALAGVDVSAVHRGDVLVTGDAWEPSTVLRADVSLLADAPRALGPRAVVRLHLGTAEVGARLVAQGGALRPGETRPVRILLDAPVVARAGDRFVLRAPSPALTIGGGTVTDAVAARRGKPFPAAAMSAAERVRWLVEEGGARGVSRSGLAIRAVSRTAELDPAIKASGVVAVPGSELLLSPVAFDSARRRLLSALDEFHRGNPLATGASLQELRTRLRLPAEFAELLVRRAIEAREIEVVGSEMRRFGWAPALSQDQETTREAVLRRLADARIEPPSVPELEAEFGGATAAILRLEASRGVIVQVEVSRYFTASAIEQIVGALGARYALGDEVAPADVRVLLGVSRKYVIPLLEYFDRAGLTRRSGDSRVWRGRHGAP